MNKKVYQRRESDPPDILHNAMSEHVVWKQIQLIRTHRTELYESEDQQLPILQGGK